MVVPIVGRTERDADKAYAVSFGATNKRSACGNGVAGFYTDAAIVFDEQPVVVIIGLVFYLGTIA